MSNQIGTLKMGQKFKKTPAGEIPVEWGVAPISDLCQVNPEVIKESTPSDTQLKYIDIASIEHTGYVSDIKSIEFKAAPSRARRVVKAGDIIVSTVRPYLKAFARITDTSSNLIASTGFAVLRPRADVCGGYIYQHVLSDDFVKYLEGRMVGSNYPAVNAGDVSEYQIPVPPIAEQKKIGQILDEVDALASISLREIEKTKRLKKGLMCQLLARGIGHTKFKKSEIGEIPAEWVVIKIGDLLDYERPDKYIVKNTDYSSDPTSGIPVLTANKSFILGYTDEDFGVCKDTPVIIFDDFTTDSKYVDFHFKVKSSAIKILRAKAGFDLKYIFEAMQLINFAVGDHKRYYISEYQNIVLPIPPLAEQKKIAGALSALDSQINRQRELFAKYSKLKTGLMKVLFTAKVRV